ncbi:MAG: polyprenyl synthetase family protein [Myxococcales bacterium]|nr:polyprenyl synthetase family protein [Myxococcales bacterium]MDP3503435.1 polyprenyl synthetase family protein [Myxococcales bacterium]
MSGTLDSALETAIASAAQGGPPRLALALEHAVFPGGARVRPRLSLAVAHACGNGAPALALGAATAIELLHCASLVHDDLPCFDDAATRRGKPSVHRAFGQPLAVLAGDALIVMAFETLGRAAAEAPSRLPPMVVTLARAVGAADGLVAGQAWESEPSVPLDAYHQAKTGSLFSAATQLGAMAAGSDPTPWRHMGELLGGAYQVADDLLDAVAADGGKPTRRDEALNRPNAVARLGIETALDHLNRLVAQAVDSIPACPGRESLAALVLQIAQRLVPEPLRKSAA